MMPEFVRKQFKEDVNKLFSKQAPVCEIRGQKYWLLPNGLPVSVLIAETSRKPGLYIEGQNVNEKDDSDTTSQQASIRGKDTCPESR